MLLLLLLLLLLTVAVCTEFRLIETRGLCQVASTRRLLCTLFSSAGQGGAIMILQIERNAKSELFVVCRPLPANKQASSNGKLNKHNNCQAQDPTEHFVMT